MHIPRIHLPKTFLLFIAGVFVGSFVTLRFNGLTTPAVIPKPHAGVLGVSVVEDEAIQVRESSETDKAHKDRSMARTHSATREAKVVRVIDGDTVELSSGERLRYIGIDAPEMSASGRERCLAEAAKAANISLVEGKEVNVSIDKSDRDRFGRSLRYVHIDGLFVNAALVDQGLARAYAYPPDTKYKEEIAQAEERAKAGMLGMWGLVCASVPGDYSGDKSAGQLNRDMHQVDCVIKGNISATGERIYHLTGCRSYEKTVVNMQDGERWFCTEQEASSAGWRKARDCL